jgi:acyl carrier protein
VLNSIETARLVAYIRETFGVRLPPTAMTARNFRDLETIAGLVAGVPVAAGVSEESA